MTNLVSAVIASGLLVGSGIICGAMTDRWGTAENLAAELPAKLAALPLEIGGWVGEDLGTEEHPAEKTTTLLRRYTQSGTGRIVMMSLTSGRANYVAVHTPDLCYPGTGFALQGKIARREVAMGTQTAPLYQATFGRNKAAGPEAVTIGWTWTPDGTWQAPAYPRLAFARSPVLVKLYVVWSPLGEGDAAADQQACDEFVGHLLGEVSRAAFGS